MAYNELIKNFDRIRAYMRDFYVYGFKSRDEFEQKSARSYDDERRRIESWLGDYMGFRQTPDGKNVFISIDSRVSHHNPLYKAFLLLRQRRILQLGCFGYLGVLPAKILDCPFAHLRKWQNKPQLLSFGQ